MIVAYVTPTGYLFCADCVDALDIPTRDARRVHHDSEPHASERCDQCRRRVRESLSEGFRVGDLLHLGGRRRNR